MQRGLLGSTVARRRNASGPLDVRFEMRLDAETARRLQAQADRLGLSLASYVRMAALRQVAHDEAEASAEETPPQPHQDDRP